MISFDKVKITQVTTTETYYNPKTKKHIKYKTPKITKKVLFEDYCFDIGELYVQIKNCHDRGYENIQVSFSTNIEY
jgi:hypothetical protein